jgi:transcription initiation factor TFIIIB Brf1 subunit/transcription initiation factor TFIIB
MSKSEFVCRACGWVANDKKISEELSEIYRQTLNQKEELKQLGFSTRFELAVYEELQSLGTDESESKNITTLIYEKVKVETNIEEWKTKKSSEKRISVTIYDILTDNKFPEDKINELLPKIIDLAGILLADVYMHTYCLRCKSHSVIFDMVRSEFVCAACGSRVEDYLDSERGDRTPYAKGKKGDLEEKNDITR